MSLAAENIFLPKEAKIIDVKRVTDQESHYFLKMADGEHVHFEPGQFLELSLFGYGEIPIGYASSPTRTESFEVVVRSVGRVSKALSKLGVGDSMFIRGPLGSGFELDKLRGHNILIVAGGIGICPTRSLIQYILDRREEFKKFSLFYGARTPSQQMFKDEIIQWRGSDIISYYETVDYAEDGWNGKVGVITELFKDSDIDPDTKVIICGPPVMFKFVLAELDRIGIERDNIYIDLERRMKCGVGKCGHCQINDKYACVDGPVFSYNEIEQLEEAI